MACIVECPHCGAEVDRDRAKLCPKCMRDISRRPARPRPVTRAAEAQVCARADCQAVLAPDAENCPYCGEAVEVQAVAAVLRVVVGGSEAELPAGETVVIGRDTAPLAEALSSLDHISRRHLRIEYGEEGIWITDMASANGTYVDGRRLEPWQRERVELGTALRLASNVEVDLHIDRGSVRAA